MSVTPESNAPPTGPHDPSPLKQLSFVQHNCLGSWDVFLSLFNSFQKLPTPPHLVLLQDPPIFRNRLPSFAFYKAFAPPPTPGTPPRVAIYASFNFQQGFSILPCFFDRPDLMALDVFSPSGLFNHSHTQLRLYNSYSVAGTFSGSRTVLPKDLFQAHSFPVLVLGDLNIHHPQSDPLRTISQQEYATSSPYFDLAHDLQFALLNSPGVFTRFPFDSSTRPGVLDLAFANHTLQPYFANWHTNLPATGSDHLPITITFCSPLLKPPPPSPDWKHTDWDSLLPALKSLSIPPPPLNPTDLSMDAWLSRHLAALTTLLRSHTPSKRPSVHAEPWWSAELSHLRQSYNLAARTHRRNRSAPSLSESKVRRNAYFKAIRKAKSAHWEEYLYSVTTTTVWDARRLASGRPSERFPSLPGASTPLDLNSSLLHHFFPPKPPSPSAGWPRPYNACSFRHPPDIARALAKSSSSSAPGPDQIPYGVWKEVNRANPAILLSLLSPLLQHGYHPKALKMANGIALPKPGKPDYSSPASFRIIVLLQTVSKILERIVATRLSLIARSRGLINTNQCGSLSGLSTFDACASLTHEVRSIQRPGIKASTLFLDIKGGFDNISSFQLSQILVRHGGSRYLVSWVRSFLSDRQCKLLFQGAPGVYCPVQVGAPQGSPVSPLLFLIYVSCLHISIPRSVILSYVDDFSVTVFSASYRGNIRALQRIFFLLFYSLARIGVSFF